MTWTIDPTHSSIEFAVKHLGISTVRGRFTRFQGTVELDHEGGLVAADAVIDGASIDTGTPDRDAHLRSADFFEVDRHPGITFRSTGVRQLAPGEYELTGDLTMRGQTHPATLRAELSPPVRDPWGNERVAATASGKLNRKDWGLTWNQALEVGGFLVGEEVRLTLDLQAVAVPAAAAA